MERFAVDRRAVAGGRHPRAGVGLQRDGPDRSGALAGRRCGAVLADTAGHDAGADPGTAAAPRQTDRRRGPDPGGHGLRRRISTLRHEGLRHHAAGRAARAEDSAAGDRSGASRAGRTQRAIVLTGDRRRRAGHSRSGRLAAADHRGLFTEGRRGQDHALGQSGRRFRGAGPAHHAADRRRHVARQRAHSAGA